MVLCSFYFLWLNSCTSLLSFIIKPNEIKEREQNHTINLQHKTDSMRRTKWKECVRHSLPFLYTSFLHHEVKEWEESVFHSFSHLLPFLECVLTLHFITIQVSKRNTKEQLIHHVLVCFAFKFKSRTSFVFNWIKREKQWNGEENKRNKTQQWVVYLVPFIPFHLIPKKCIGK